MTVSLCSQKDVEALVQKEFSEDSTPTDEQVADWIADVSRAIEERTGKTYSATVVEDEKHDGDGTPYIMLRNYPVLSVESLTVDEQELTENEDFWLMDDGLSGGIECLVAPQGRVEGSATGHQNITCSYTYGTEVVPALVKEYASTIVAIKAVNAAGLLDADGGVVKNYSDGDIAISYSDKDTIAAGLVQRYQELQKALPVKVGAAST